MLHENTIASPSMGGYFWLKHKPLCYIYIHTDSQKDSVTQLECVKCIYSEELHRIDTYMCGDNIFNLNRRALLFPNILFHVVCLEVSHISEPMVDYIFYTKYMYVVFKRTELKVALYELLSIDSTVEGG